MLAIHLSLDSAEFCLQEIEDCPVADLLSAGSVEYQATKYRDPFEVDQGKVSARLIRNPRLTEFHFMKSKSDNNTHDGNCCGCDGHKSIGELRDPPIALPNTGGEEAHILTPEIGHRPAGQTTHG